MPPRTSESFEIEEANTVLSIVISQTLPTIRAGEHSSWIAVSLLDANGTSLLTLGDDLWSAGGRDGDGPWTEKQTAYTAHLTVKERGRYALAFESELAMATDEEPGSIRYRVAQRRGSPVLLYWLGGIAAVVGGLFAWRWLSLAQQAGDIG